MFDFVAQFKKTQKNKQNFECGIGFFLLIWNIKPSLAKELNWVLTHDNITNITHSVYVLLCWFFILLNKSSPWRILR